MKKKILKTLLPILGVGCVVGPSILTTGCATTKFIRYADKVTDINSHYISDLRACIFEYTYEEELVIKCDEITAKIAMEDYDKIVLPAYLGDYHAEPWMITVLADYQEVSHMFWVSFSSWPWQETYPTNQPISIPITIEGKKGKKVLYSGKQTITIRQKEIKPE